jgi:archaetidylinositol phosphate synthase
LSTNDITPWDQRAARILVKPLAHTPVTPNQITVLTIIIAWTGASLLSTGDSDDANLGAGLFVLARFLDHFDGELARLTGRTSRVGYYLDYLAGALSYAAMFAGIGLGLAHSSLGNWALALGVAGSLCAILAMPMNLSIDTLSGREDAVGYPQFAGFELEDGIYLLAPITWLGWLQPFFVLAGIGACVYLAWTLRSMLSAGRK